MRKVRIFAYIFLCLLFTVPFWGAQYAYIDHPAMYPQFYQDTVTPTDISVDSITANIDSIIAKNDSILIKGDSISPFRKDTAIVDTTRRKDGLDAVVDYKSNDSIVMTADNWGYLFGEAEVNYTNIKLTGEKLSMNMDSSIVYAEFGLDSIGKEFGFPVFSDGGTDYESRRMRYNFKSKKGYITNVTTVQGEGYVIANQAKKNDDNSFYMRGGKYTTCDNHEHPHFYLAMTKAKVQPKKNVITGPAYLVIEDLPIPIIGLPFGFFPFSDSYSSGVIMPSYGDDMERGFNLRDGGYYFAINDNIDLALTGEIYTKGSWGINARSTYRKRYKYSGNFNMSYLVSKYGDKGLDDYSVGKDVRINWSHSQDPKANIYRTLSANVDFATSSYNRNSVTGLYSTAGTNNTKSSTVNFTQKIPNSPWSFSGTMTVNQRTSDSTISMTLPNLTITMSRIAPFKRKEAVGAERWYEKIMVSYTGDLRNSITTKEDKLFKSNLQKDWVNGMQHSIPVTATFNAFNYLNISPSFNYRERWYTRSINKEFNNETKNFVNKDTTYSFNRVYDYDFSVSLDTKIYGMFTPIFSKTTQIRHVFSPSIGFTYAPDFGDPKKGYYQTYHFINSKGEMEEYTYSPYAGGLFSPPQEGERASINIAFDNNVEMKYKASNDSLKKISLIDQLRISTNYNFKATEYKLQDIQTSLRLKLSKSLTVNVNATWDPYLYDVVDGKPKKMDKLRIANGKGFGRLKSTGYSISPSINQDTFKKWFGRGEKKDTAQDTTGEDDTEETPMMEDTSVEGNAQRVSMLEKKDDDNQYDEDGYIKNEIKWNLAISFGMNYSYNMSNFDYEKKEYKGQLTKNLSFSGNIQPTRNWSFNFNASYDFDQKKISYMSCSLTRDLHCWSISANVNPFGQYKSYMVTLRASSSMLQDLKYEQRGRTTSYDPNWD